MHQADNLDEAVQLYEELLAYRDPPVDPLGRARLLANQGNALGHLGVFADARERLDRAAALFASGRGDRGRRGRGARRLVLVEAERRSRARPPASARPAARLPRPAHEEAR